MTGKVEVAKGGRVSRKTDFEKLYGSTALAAILLCMAPSAVLAQEAPKQDETPAAQAEPAPEDGTDKAIITVTGSRIRGVPPVGSSLISMGREEIRLSGGSTVGDILKDVPQVTSLGVDAAHRGVGGGGLNLSYGSAANLRGLGPAATLLLFDGRRMVHSSVGTFVESTNVPAIALERAEVIADGASAIYGSDAVAGVINLITRRRFSGSETSVRYGMADSYKDFQVGQLLGHQWDTGGIVVAYEHVYQSRLKGVDRDFYRQDLRPFGGSDFRNTTCAPGTIIVGTTNYALPGLTAGTRNLCDTVQYSDILPQQVRDNGYVSIRQELGENFEISAEGFYFHKDFSYRLTKGTGTRGLASTTLTVPSTNPYFINPTGVPQASVRVGYFLGADLGTYDEDYGPENTYQGTVALNWKIGGDWNAELAATFGRNHNGSTRTQVNTAALNAALASSNPATAFNPFGAGGSNPAPVIAAINDFAIVRDNYNELDSYELQVGGTVFELPGGPVKLAVGGEYRREYNNTSTIQGPAANRVGGGQAISRTVKSVYGEVLVPIFGGENATGGFQKLLLSVAGRFEDYSDFGTTVNPKIGVTWEPVNGLSFRGSYGTSFRAPDLRETLPPGPTFLIVPVPSFDPTTNTTRTVLQLSGGFPDLVPETAKTFSLGFDLRPDAVPGFHFSGTYFTIDYTGQIISLAGDSTILQREAQYPGLIYRNQADILALVNLYVGTYGVPISGGVVPPLNTVAAFLDGRRFNLGTTQSNILDFDLGYRVKTDGAGTFSFGANATYILNFKVAVSPTAPVIERVGQINFPQQFHGRGYLGWSKGPFDATFFVNYISSYWNTTSNPTQNVKSWTTFDLAAGLEIGDFLGGGPFRDLRLSVNATNLFDKDPPFVNLSGAGGGYDGQVHSAIGRKVTIGFTKKF